MKEQIFKVNNKSTKRKVEQCNQFFQISQCSKLTIETLEQGMKYDHS